MTPDSTLADNSEASSERLPHRSKFLLPVLGFLRQLLDLHREILTT